MEHAEQCYQHSRYPALLALLPGLLDAAREAHAARPGVTDALLVSVYALIALGLVKVDQGELAVRKLVAVVSRSADAPSGLAQLAATLQVG